MAIDTSRAGNKRLGKIPTFSHHICINYMSTGLVGASMCVTVLHCTHRALVTMRQPQDENPSTLRKDKELVSVVKTK